MARLLNATGYFSSVLAVVCLVLALVAAPISEARADDPNNVMPYRCSGPGRDGCTPGNQPDCVAVGTCRIFDGGAVCICKWVIVGYEDNNPILGCSCAPNAI